MPTFEIMSPDGKKYRVNAPEGATQDDAIAYVQSNFSKSSPAQAPLKIGKEGFADAMKEVISEHNPLTAAIASAGNTVMQYARGFKQMTGLGDTAEGKNWDVLDKELATQFPIAHATGDIGAQIGLTYLGAKAIPSSVVTKAPILGNPYVANTATGAALGGFKYGDLNERLTEGALGAGGGAVGTLIGRAIPAAYQGAKAIVEPFTKGGQENIAGRVLRRFAVDPTKVEQAGLYASSVPGVKPSLAEAALDPGISNLQRQYAVGLTENQLANNAARVSQLRSAGGSEADIARKIAERSAVVDPLYNAADNAVVTSDEQLRGIMKRLPKGTLETARDIARMEGKPIQFGKDVSASTIYKDAAGNVVEADMLKPPTGPKELNFLSELRNAGGISRDLYMELGLTPKEAVRGNPGLFRKNGLTEDGLVEWMQNKGWLTDSMIENANKYDTGGATELAKDYLRSALAKNPVYHPSQAMDIAAHNNAMRDFMDWQSTLTKVDIPEKNAKYTGKGIDLIKKAIDDRMSGEAGSSIGKNQKNAIASVKSDLLNWADSRIPEYAQARQQFGELSKPINSMQIANELFRKSTSAAEDALGNPTLRNEALSRAVRDGDQVARNITKFDKATLTNSLEPDALDAIKAVRKDLARKAASENLGKATGSPTAQNLAAQNIMRQIAGPLGVPQGFAEANIWPTLLRPVNWALKAQEPNIENVMIRAMNDPAFAAYLASKSGARSSVNGLLGSFENYAIPAISSGLLDAHQ